jgi:tripartite-type tricarboxylate transporter receptor subunit TctC
MKESFLIILSISLTALFCTAELHAGEQYPAKPIQCILATEAGSDLDLLTRSLLQKASVLLGKPILPVNKPGGGTVIGTLETYRSKPDGYTIGVNSMALVVSRLQGLLPFDYNELTFFGTFYKMYTMIFGAAKTKRPFKTIQEAISFAKSHPGELSVAPGGIGTSPWVGAMAFISGTGIDVNVIPQPGGTGFVMSQIAGGHMDLAVAHLPAAIPQMQAGNIRFLAVIGEERSAGYESVPTLKDIGYDVSWEACGFVFGPPRVPKDIMDKLAKVFETATNDPDYKKFLADRYVTPFYVSPEKMGSYLDGRRRVARQTMEKAGILKEK